MHNGIVLLELKSWLYYPKEKEFGNAFPEGLHQAIQFVQDSLLITLQSKEAGYYTHSLEKELVYFSWQWERICIRTSCYFIHISMFRSTSYIVTC